MSNVEYWVTVTYVDPQVDDERVGPYWDDLGAGEYAEKHAEKAVESLDEMYREWLEGREEDVDEVSAGARFEWARPGRLVVYDAEGDEAVSYTVEEVETDDEDGDDKEDD